MATDLEKLVVVMDANLRSLEREMQRAVGVSDRQARAIEKRFRAMNKNLDGIGRGAAQSLIAPLAGVAAGLSVKAVLDYADAWTKAKNSLAVAGVTGAQQALVLDQLFQSAQANATPIGALSDLYGKAAQASDNLGASQADLLKFSDGVATALRVAGTSAGAASGALTQLGQLLGSARVQAEEFNSVNEGARPILIAVANGLDAAGGSVNKLKQLVNDGKVSGQQFFQAFLKGLPSIQSMAANATQTIEGGITKVSNALTRYIGETDASLGASQRLVQGLNALADNFDKTADVVLMVAGVIAGGLVGRALAGMLVSLNLGASALLRFVGALRAAMAAGTLATALGGVTAVAGPLGFVIGGAVVGALALFSRSSDTATLGAEAYARAVKRVEDNARQAADSVKDLANAPTSVVLKALEDGLHQAQKEVSALEADFDALVTQLTNLQTINGLSDQQVDQLQALNAQFKEGKISVKQLLAELQKLASTNAGPPVDGLNAFIARAKQALLAVRELNAESADLLISSGRASDLPPSAVASKMNAAGDAFVKDYQRRASMTKDAIALEKALTEVRKEAAAAGVNLTDAQANTAAQAQLAGDKARSSEGKKPKAAGAVRATADSRFDADIQAVRDRTAALVAEREALGQSAVDQEARRIALELEQTALADLREEARRKGQTDLESIQLGDAQKAMIRDVSQAYAEQAIALSDAQQSMEEMNDLGREVVSGIVSDLREGKGAAEAFANAVDRLTDRLIDMALNSLFDSRNGGIFGLLGKAFGFSGGGVVQAATGGYIRGPGSGTSDSIPARLSNGEYVVNARATRDNRALLEAINTGRVPRFADGGFVGVPSIPAGVGRAAAPTFAPSYTIDARGSQMTEQQFRAILAEHSKAQMKQIQRQMPGWNRDYQMRHG